MLSYCRVYWVQCWLIWRVIFQHGIRMFVFFSESSAAHLRLPVLCCMQQRFPTSSVKVVRLHCAELATKIIICRLKPAFAIEICATVIQVIGGKGRYQIVHPCFFLEQERHWIICGQQCLVVTWSFMDQLFPFWFNSPCDWFSVPYCWKISTLNRAWNRESFEYRCLQLRPCHWKPLGARRQLQVDYVASDRSCKSFVQGRDICI